MNTSITQEKEKLSVSDIQDEDLKELLSRVLVQQQKIERLKVYITCNGFGRFS